MFWVDSVAFPVNMLACDVAFCSAFENADALSDVVWASDRVAEALVTSVLFINDRAPIASLRFLTFGRVMVSCSFATNPLYVA